MLEEQWALNFLLILLTFKPRDPEETQEIVVFCQDLVLLEFESILVAELLEALRHVFWEFVREPLIVSCLELLPCLLRLVLSGMVDSF